MWIFATFKKPFATILPRLSKVILLNSTCGPMFCMAGVAGFEPTTCGFGDNRYISIYEQASILTNPTQRVNQSYPTFLFYLIATIFATIFNHSFAMRGEQ